MTNHIENLGDPLQVQYSRRVAETDLETDYLKAAGLAWSIIEKDFKEKTGFTSLANPETLMHGTLSDGVFDLTKPQLRFDRNLGKFVDSSELDFVRHGFSHGIAIARFVKLYFFYKNPDKIPSEIRDLVEKCLYNFSFEYILDFEDPSQKPLVDALDFTLQRISPDGNLFSSLAPSVATTYVNRIPLLQGLVDAAFTRENLSIYASEDSEFRRDSFCWLPATSA